MEYFLFALILALANIVQAITGFAGGPLAMPPSIALVGINDAKASITLIFLLSTAVITFTNIKYINPKKLGIMILFMVIGMIPGLWLYDRLPTKILMIVYGVIVVGIGIWKLIGKGKPIENKYLLYLALIMAGAMQGMFTSGGPFLALYATVAISEKKEFRATVSAVWTILNIYLCYNMLTQGMYNSKTINLTLVSIVPVAAAIVVGNIINKKIKQETFIKLVYILLIVSGGILLLNAL